MNDLLATNTSSPAFALGYLVGLVGFIVFAVVAIVRAFTRRTTGWIIAGSVCGLFLAIPILVLIGGFISGIMPAHEQSSSRAAASQTSDSALQAGASFDPEHPEKSVLDFKDSLVEFAQFSDRLWQHKNDRDYNGKKSVQESLQACDRLAKAANNYLGQRPSILVALKRRGASPEDIENLNRVLEKLDEVAVVAIRYVDALRAWANSKTMEEAEQRAKPLTVERVEFLRALKEAASLNPEWPTPH